MRCASVYSKYMLHIQRLYRAVYHHFCMVIVILKEHATSESFDVMCDS